MGVKIPFNHPILLLLCCSLCHSVQAQPFLAAEHPKARTAQKVLEDLVNAIGDNRSPPHLRLAARGAVADGEVAWLVFKQDAIVLEEEAYDACVAMGADSLNGLAGLLGHELAHFYKDHEWVGDFAQGFADLTGGQQGVHLGAGSGLLIETEADYFGGFYAQVAGYQVLDTFPRLLQGIYDTYNLEHARIGYPSLAKRQQIAAEAAGKLRRMLPFFEAGNMLLLIGEYESAALCFDHLSRDFPSREILNNAGVARVLEAIALFPQDELRFAYPLELDAESRLGRGSKATEYQFDSSDRQRQQRLLREAYDLFDRARRLDTNYPTAYINLACAADLLGEADEAQVWALKAVKMAKNQAQQKQLASGLLIQGIAKIHQDPTAVAAVRQSFEKAKQGRLALAQLNLAALEGKRLEPLAEKEGFSNERIGGQSAAQYNDILDEPDLRIDLPLPGQARPAFTLFTKDYLHHQGLVVDTGYSYVVFLSTGQGYNGSTGRGLKKGDSLPQLHQHYGQPVRRRAARQGDFMVYENSPIIFLTDAENKLQEWTLYKVDD